MYIIIYIQTDVNYSFINKSISLIENLLNWNFIFTLPLIVYQFSLYIRVCNIISKSSGNPQEKKLAAIRERRQNSCKKECP